MLMCCIVTGAREENFTMNCEMCRQQPCDPRCPNAPEPETRGYCDQCGEGLREDCTYYEDKEFNKFCSDDCAIEFNEICERRWD